MTSESCPICGKTFEDENDRPATQYGSAAMRVKVHMRIHRAEAKETEADVPEVTERERNPFDAPTGEVRPGSQPGPATPRKWWQRKTRDAQTSPSGHPRERSPRRSGTFTGRRLPAADFLGDVYGGVGSLVGRATPYRATARALSANAPVAGYMLDDAVKGTVIDRVVVQPGVRVQQKYSQVSGLFEVPVLVFLAEQEMMKGDEANRQKIEGLVMMLKSAIRRSLPAMVPALKKLREDEKKIAEAVAELYPDLPEGTDPVDAILAEWFAAEPEPQPMPEEAMA